MTTTTERSVRLSQTLAPFGVGAIYDFMGESLVACETAWWKGHGTKLRLRRLEEQLEVSGFRSAPSHASLFGRSSPKVPYYRFPQWLFCPRCRRMTHWRVRMEVEGEPPCCRMDHCPGQAQLVPMRFVVVCEDGHMDDVPWQLWAHLGAKTADHRQCKSRDLSFLARKAAGTGLGSLQIKCNTCKSPPHSLGGISSKDSLLPFRVRCSGRQPWQKFEEAESCDETPQVLQRGATNVYFARVTSAIDIPPESDYLSFGDIELEVTNAPEFPIIVSNPSGPMAVLGIRQLAERLKVPEDRIRTLVQEHIDALEGKGGRTAGASASDSATEEWLAFQTDQEEKDDRDHFITRRADFLTDDDSPALAKLDELVDRVVVATRLREVRALVGFSRLRPDARLLAPGLGRVPDWLPAIEVFGEGIFLSLSEDAVSRWERLEAVAQIAAGLEARRESSLFGPRLGVAASPRFLLLHTLAHLLIRQLSFDCGYAASSLRERIYARDPANGDAQAGLLIYTAAGDLEGTLGGLVRQGEPPRLARTLLRALERAGWCSADPLCRESPGQGFGAMNLGACHACALVSETSCIHFNVLLDRGLVVGSDSVDGFFSAVLDAAIGESSRRSSAQP